VAILGLVYNGTAWMYNMVAVLRFLQFKGFKIAAKNSGKCQTELIKPINPETYSYNTRKLIFHQGGHGSPGRPWFTREAMVHPGPFLESLMLTNAQKISCIYVSKIISKLKKMQFL